MKLHLARPWLEIDLGAPHRVLSWSLSAPGFTHASHILWREVRNADLPPDMDVRGWLRDRLRERGRTDAVAMLTSRDLDAYETARATVGGVTATCVATVGLSNAERVGARVDRRDKDWRDKDWGDKDWGTINLAVCLDAGLGDGALLETLSIATQARTAAVMDVGYRLPTGIATGTGTDCIAVAAPAGNAAFAGLHTPPGEAVGRAVYDAIHQGAQVWMNEVRRRDDP